MSRIECKVAQVLNVREVVLNRGEDAGVQLGMKFAVLNSKGANITDPDTRRPLGSVEVPKALVRVVRLYPNMAVARTYRTRRTNVGGIGSLAIFQAFEPQKYVDVPETLKVADGGAYAEIDEKDSVVKRGDPAVQMTGDEFEITPD